MKQLFFLAVIVALSAATSKGQCVIYTCDNTGAWGAGYNDETGLSTMQECSDMALKYCKDNGGTDCHFMYKSEKQGWIGFITGESSDGRILFYGTAGHSTKEEAERAARSGYRNADGLEADNVNVTTWYVYNNTD